jgi:hypothetical protein
MAARSRLAGRPGPAKPSAAREPLTPARARHRGILQAQEPPMSASPFET